MNELITIIGINVIVIIASIVWEYLQAVNDRKIFDEQLFKLDNTSSKKAKTNSLVFFPGEIGQKLVRTFNKKKLDTPLDKKTPFLKQVTPANLILANVALFIIAYNIQTLFKVPWYVFLLIFVVGQGVIFFYLRGKQIKIREAVEKKLPEILDMMARVYRVHSDLRVAIQEVATHSSDEIVRDQFRQVAQLSRFGYSVEESLDYVAKDIQSADFDFVVSSIKLNAPVGGNLPYLFEHTAQMLRQRKEATDEINNLMFQSKISATISALLVPVITIVSFISSQKYQDALLHNPTGRMIFFFSLIWWFIGVVIIRKNSRIAL